jgi:hypothetical protein
MEGNPLVYWLKKTIQQALLFEVIIMGHRKFFIQNSRCHR